MNKCDIKRLGLILALQAEIEGMKFENLQREQFQNSHAYADKDFFNKAADIRVIIYATDNEINNYAK